MSRFLQRASCFLDKSGMRAAPGFAHCSQLNSCNHDKLLASMQLLPRHCAVLIYKSSLTMKDSVHLDKLCHDTRAPQLNPTWTAKTRAIPSWHRDCFPAQEPGCARCSRRVTQPPFIAVPLASIPRTDLKFS